jgi:hypothetical protein
MDPTERVDISERFECQHGGKQTDRSVLDCLSRVINVKKWKILTMSLQRYLTKYNLPQKQEI